MKTIAVYLFIMNWTGGQPVKINWWRGENAMTMCQEHVQAIVDFGNPYRALCIPVMEPKEGE